MNPVQQSLPRFFSCLCTARNLAQLLVLRIVARANGSDSEASHSYQAGASASTAFTGA